MERPKYYRRCHVCGGLCETDLHHVERCSHCGKALAQFHYFDDRLSPVQSDRTFRNAPAEGIVQPIHGLTAYWEAF